MILLLYKDAYFNTNLIHVFLVFLLHEFEDVFLDKIPNEFPPIKGIEHHIDLVLG